MLKKTLIIIGITSSFFTLYILYQVKLNNSLTNDNEVSESSTTEVNKKHESNNNFDRDSLEVSNDFKDTLTEITSDDSGLPVIETYDE
ncbi:MAG TPA: hypothetical protein VIG40_05745 [Tissierellaceae bacterium]